MIKSSATDQIVIARLALKLAAVEIHRSDAQIKVVLSGRRFGKTRLMLAAGLEMCLKNYGAELFYLAQCQRRAIDDPLWI